MKKKTSPKKASPKTPAEKSAEKPAVKRPSTKPPSASAGKPPARRQAGGTVGVAGGTVGVADKPGTVGAGLAPPPATRSEVLETRKLTDEKWLNLFVRTFRRDGVEHRWLFASRKPEPGIAAAGVGKPDAVLIVPILVGGPEPLLVATREWRVPIGAYEWGVPAGLVDGDETPAETARRELWEETGYELVEVTEVSPLNYSSTGMTDEGVQMVFCTCRKPKHHKQHLDGAEEIEVRLLTIADIRRLVTCDEPVNGRAWLTFYMYHRLGKLA